MLRAAAGALLIGIAFLAWIAVGAPAASAPDATILSEGQTVSSLYDLKTTTLDGKPADLGAYRGKVTVVVNVASKCGFTPQYEGLEALHKELAPKGVSVLGFPSNDFGWQEPGTAEQIAEFCRLTYGVTFPMFEKVVTRAGAKQSPVYAFLGAASGKLPSWNFCKYVVGKDGRVLAYFSSRTKPDAKELRAAIDQALAAN